MQQPVNKVDVNRRDDYRLLGEKHWHKQAVNCSEKTQFCCAEAGWQAHWLYVHSTPLLEIRCMYDRLYVPAKINSDHTDRNLHWFKILHNIVTSR